MTQAEDDRWSYSGYLLFNNLLRYDGMSKGDLESQLMELAEDIERLKIRPQTPIKEDKRSPMHLKEIVPDFSLYRLEEESTKETEAYVDGELRIVEVPSTQSVDVVLTEDYLFIRGPKSMSEDISEYLQKSIQYGDLYEIRFDPDFFTWVLYEYINGRKLSSKLNVNLLTDCKVAGDHDSYGEFNRVSGSQDIQDSIPILMGILSGKKITSLGGEFILEGYQNIRADISLDSLHVKAGHDAFAGVTDVNRMLLSISFINVVCRCFELWSQLSSEERYPPPQFFEDLRDRLQSSGVDLEFSAGPVIDEYREKRKKDQ